jgi:hypothetical protein
MLATPEYGTGELVEQAAMLPVASTNSQKRIFCNERSPESIQLTLLQETLASFFSI